MDKKKKNIVGQILPTKNILVNCGQVNGRNKKVPNAYYIKFNNDYQLMPFQGYVKIVFKRSTRI